MSQQAEEGAGNSKRRRTFIALLDIVGAAVGYDCMRANAPVGAHVGLHSLGCFSVEACLPRLRVPTDLYPTETCHGRRHPEVKYSLQCRGKHAEDMNKSELLDLLYDDIVLEKKV